MRGRREAPPRTRQRPNWVWFGVATKLGDALNEAEERGYRQLEWMLAGESDGVTGEPRVLAWGRLPDPDCCPICEQPWPVPDALDETDDLEDDDGAT